MTHPNSFSLDQSSTQKVIDSDPFDGMKINDTSELDRLTGRSACLQCGKSRKFFCYTCYIPVMELDGKLPRIKLPIKIDIIKHKHEIDGKSTACHAAILASEDVTIYTYPNIPDYNSRNDIVLIFPSANARTVQQILHNSNVKNRHEHLPKGHHQGTLMKVLDNNLHDDTVIKKLNELSITRAVFIDSTWNQSRGIYKDDRIKKLPCVVIHNRISQFWRHQKGSPRWYLATIEAIHQFLIEMHINVWGVCPSYNGLKQCFTDEYYVKFYDSQKCSGDKAYEGQYDNLLFFFKHMYDLIHSYYDHEQLYAYKRSENHRPAFALHMTKGVSHLFTNCIKYNVRAWNNEVKRAFRIPGEHANQLHHRPGWFFALISGLIGWYIVLSVCR